MAEDNSVTALFVLGIAIVVVVYMFWKRFIYKQSLDDKLRKNGYDINEPVEPIRTHKRLNSKEDIGEQLLKQKQEEFEERILNQQREDLEKQRHNEVNGITAHPLEPKPNEPAAVTRLRETADTLKTNPDHQRRSANRQSLGTVEDTEDEGEQWG